MRCKYELLDGIAEHPYHKHAASCTSVERDFVRDRTEDIGKHTAQELVIVAGIRKEEFLTISIG
jgi:hypothetical protein